MPEAEGLRVYAETCSGVRNSNVFGQLRGVMHRDPCPSSLGDDGTLGPVPQLLGEHEDATTVSGEVEVEPTPALDRIIE